MRYSYVAKNTEPDRIYLHRLELIDKMKFDYNKTARRYSYYMNAALGIILH
jgi:hypothetical protein